MNLNAKRAAYAVILILLCAALAGVVAMRTGGAEESEPAVVMLPVATEAPAAAEPTPTPTAEPTPEPTPTPTPEPYADKPDVDITSWELLLVNAEHNIGDYTPELTAVEGGHYFDSRAAESLEAFIAAARAEGLSVYLSSSYRSYDEQSYLFNRKVAQYNGDEETAATIVARPGTSEHQTGLCCDITDRYYELKTSELENTELYQWMSAHCAEYGFIVRYPKDREDSTGIIYEPWHFRYVGVEAAEYITENSLTLEEFTALYAESET